MASDLKSFAMPQDDSNATYSFWRDDGEFQLQWSESAVAILQLVNAVGYPNAGAKTSHGNRELTAVRAELTKGVNLRIGSQVRSGGDMSPSLWTSFVVPG